MAYEQLKLDNQLCFRLYTAARLTMGALYKSFLHKKKKRTFAAAYQKESPR